MPTTMYEDNMLQPEMSSSMRLYYFINDAWIRFKEVIDARHVIFYEEVREPIVAAYEELSKDQFPKLSNLLEAKEVSEDDLQSAGLSGSPLILKLQGYLHARNEFIRRGGIKLLKSVFDWMNSIFGSLAVVPGVGPLVEPIKELKEAMENIIGETEGL